MRRDKHIENLLKINDFELARNKNHNVYSHKNCTRKLVTSKTSSDSRSFKNVMKDIKNYFIINELGVPVL
jgi:hypothetical protein